MPNGAAHEGTSLERIAQNIRRCQRCGLWKGAIYAVPGEGPRTAKAILVGQNPGAEENKVGRPFVGRSGKYLNGVLERDGIDREELFITSVVKHATPKNRKPDEVEAAACMPYLIEQIGIIKPKIIVLMGALAQTLPMDEGITYIKTCHPAAAMRFPKFREVFESDIKRFKTQLDVLP
jgi:DNA polymerase